MAKMHSDTQHEWLLKKNCSLSPVQTGIAYAAPCVVTLLFTMTVVLQGIWHILIFWLMQVGLMLWAFIHYARHATDHEHIVLMESCLLVESIEANHVKQTRLDPHWTRVTLPKRYQDLVKLESKGVTIEIGRFVTRSRRRKIGVELCREMNKIIRPHPLQC
jgi:uncharacterized membrane protein